MPEAKPKKIVYLFGAGATHAELLNIEQTAGEKEEERGLLMSNVSTRVIERARHNPKYLTGAEMVSGTSGSLNIELLISLFENSKIEDWEFKANHLKTLVREDIEGILTTDLTAQFYLHKALFELHNQEIVKRQEQLLGLISLNYDDVLDQAYRVLIDGDPNYFFSLDRDTPSSRNVPLLKLHGSFNWMKGVTIRGRTRRIEIIPLGSTKNYIHAPYGFIWSQALEMLTECDTLRVIGCSLSQNDTHLIDLLFKAHLEKGKALLMEIIDFEDMGEKIQTRYGFFTEIERLSQIEGGQVTDWNTSDPFKTWLKYKGDRMLKEAIGATHYLKEVYAP